jgi:putative ABC transport system substrate-binding protein
LRHAVPAIYQFPELATAGGLISYGSSSTEMYRQAGVYTGRILKGEKPGDLPVQQSTKVELVLNLETAKALGLSDAHAARPSRRGDRMRRREFMALLGGLVACPTVALAQQPAPPVIGFLSARSRSESTHLTVAFRKGLNDVGYIEGRNVTIEYRWADGQYDRLPGLAADLVQHHVAVLFAFTNASALAAKASGTTVPVIFAIGSDPVELGLVSSINRPEGNFTGVFEYAGALGAKRIGLLGEVVPKAAVIASLLNPNNPNFGSVKTDLQEAARTLGRHLIVVTASNEGDLDAAFAALVQQRIGALLVATADPFLTSRRDQLVALAARYKVPTVYPLRDFPDAGGLMSYGTSQTDSHRQAGNYVGRVLRGAKVAELPVLQPTRFELVINLKTAKALGLDVPVTALARADEVIE